MDTPTSPKSGADTGRPNTERAAEVDQALAMLDQQGLHAAAQFLQKRGAPFGLVCRVLTEPARRRRATDLVDASYPSHIST